MFTSEPYYHQTTKRLITVFGTMFNNIHVVKEDRDGTEQRRLTVPLAYQHKKAWHRILKEYSDRDEDKNTVQGYFPRMSFNLIDMTPLKENQLTRQVLVRENGNGGLTRSFLRTKYRLTFELTIVAKQQEDLYQIVEQILPYFSPSVAVSFKSSRIFGSTFTDDFILTLSDISPDDELEFSYAQAANTQLVTRFLTFTTEITYYGPSTNASGVIKEVDVDFIDGNTGKGMSKVIVEIDPEDSEASSFGSSCGVFLLDDDFSINTSATLGASGLL